MIWGRQVGGEQWKTSFATEQWSLCAVRARCFVPLRAGDCLLKQRCGTTKRWKKSRAARSNAMAPRRPAHSRKQRRVPMHGTDADCWRVETFAKAVKLGGSIAQNLKKRRNPGFPFGLLRSSERNGQETRTNRALQRRWRRAVPSHMHKAERQAARAPRPVILRQVLRRPARLRPPAVP